MTPQLYVASKTTYGNEWRKLRASGVPIISTWIDVSGVGETVDFDMLWIRCLDEASTCTALVAFRGQGESLADIADEIAAALSHGKHVFGVGFEDMSIAKHHMFHSCPNMTQAFQQAINWSKQL